MIVNHFDLRDGVQPTLFVKLYLEIDSLWNWDQFRAKIIKFEMGHEWLSYERQWDGKSQTRSYILYL